MQQFELDGGKLVMATRKVQKSLTCAKKRNDNVNVRRSHDRLPDEKQEEGNVEYGKDHGASHGIDTVVVGNSHDVQEVVKDVG